MAHQYLLPFLDGHDAPQVVVTHKDPEHVWDTAPDTTSWRHRRQMLMPFFRKLLYPRTIRDNRQLNLEQALFPQGLPGSYHAPKRKSWTKE
jgi:hypothetical protein